MVNFSSLLYVGGLPFRTPEPAAQQAAGACLRGLGGVAGTAEGGGTVDGELGRVRGGVVEAGIDFGRVGVEPEAIEHLRRSAARR